MDLIPEDLRDQAIVDIVLGRRTMWKVAKDLGLTDMTVSRYMATVDEDRRLEIVARRISQDKLDDALRNADAANALGDDIQTDVRWLLTELKSLLASAKGDSDRVLQLGTLKELRHSLMALADLQGKLSRKVEVKFALHESPAFLELRRVMMEVLEKHPEAKADFLDRMGRLKVIENGKVLSR